MAEQGCCDSILVPHRTKRSGEFRDKDTHKLSRSSFLIGVVMLLLAIYVATGAAISCQDTGTEPLFKSGFQGEVTRNPSPHTRRQLAVNLTKSTLEDGEALLQIKSAIVSDPFNITYWWRRSGAKKIPSPCRIRNSTAQYWPGINCTNRRVTEINLANMNLTGTLSPYLGALTFLRTLDLSNNLLTGQIPSEIFTSNLQTLNLANNRLDGALPALNTTNLTSLNVANNRITGEIPQSIGELRRLETLNATGNNFSGEIPEAINRCEKLSVLDLSRNALGGRVPLQNLTSLTVLRLERNQLEGEFVSRLETLFRLEDLDLSHNLLNGSITSGIAKLQLRRDLLLHHNNLTGTIPDELGGLALVARVDLSSNALTGRIPATVRELLSLRELNVSFNNLRDEIPPALAQLPSLVTLDVSKNSISGELPAFGQVKTLRWLDAANNSLRGALPESFVDYAALTYLNVSYNELRGPVPFFHEHEGVTRRSFIGTGLCGPAIRVRCDDRPHNFTVIAIAVGSAVAFVVLFAILYVLCSRRREKERQHMKFKRITSTESQLRLAPEDVMRATWNFQEKLAEGVFRGVLRPGETHVAVRKLEGVRGDAAAGALEALALLRHWSLVKVLGFCCAPELTALVTEYMPNGSLRDLMYGDGGEKLNWRQRLNAAIGVAEGLRYLHHDCAAPTVHGDLKPSNILFNTFMEARITAFGVAKLLAEHGGARRALERDDGYKAPECANLATYTMKGDVYSFGVILLEMISGRAPHPEPLPHWIRATLSASKSLPDILAPALAADLAPNQQKISMALGVALLCTRDHPQERPYITEVLKMLTHIKSRSQRLRSTPSMHLRNEEIRHEVPGIEIAPSPPVTPGGRVSSPSLVSESPSFSEGVSPMMRGNPSLSSWTPSPENR